MEVEDSSEIFIATPRYSQNIEIFRIPLNVFVLKMKITYSELLLTFNYTTRQLVILQTSLN